MNYIQNQNTWFQRMLSAGETRTFTVQATITPDIAREMLANNQNNRAVSSTNLRNICTDILEGRFMLNGETIIVSRDGLLNDGQTRLTAVVKTNTPIESLVVFGVSRQARFTIDMGKQRTTGEFFTMGGVKNATYTASIVRLHGQYLRGDYAHSTEESKVRLQERYYGAQAAYDSAVNVVGAMRELGRAPCGVAWIILNEVNPEACAEFFEMLRVGAGLDVGNPILPLRNRLMAKERIKAEERLELILRGWNLWRRDYRATRSPKIIGCWPDLAD